MDDREAIRLAAVPVAREAAAGLPVPHVFENSEGSAFESELQMRLSKGGSRYDPPRACDQCELTVGHGRYPGLTMPPQEHKGQAVSRRQVRVIPLGGSEPEPCDVCACAQEASAALYPVCGSIHAHGRRSGPAGKGVAASMNQSFACLVSRGARWRSGLIHESPCAEHQRRGRQHEPKRENAHLLWSMNQLSLGAKVLDSGAVCVVTSEVRFPPFQKLFTRRRSASAAPAGRKRKALSSTAGGTHVTPLGDLRPGSRLSVSRANCLSRQHRQSSAAGESCGKARLRVDLERSCDVGEGAQGGIYGLTPRLGRRRAKMGRGRRTNPPAQGRLWLYECSRGGGTRTPGLRFWRPPLYQLSYAPGLMGL